MAETNGKKRKQPAPKDEAPKLKANSGYTLYQSAKREAHKSEWEDLPFLEQSRLAAAMWQKESEAVKGEWKKKYANAVIQHWYEVARWQEKKKNPQANEANSNKDEEEEDEDTITIKTPAKPAKKSKTDDKSSSSQTPAKQAKAPTVVSTPAPASSKTPSAKTPANTATKKAATPAPKPTQDEDGSDEESSGVSGTPLTSSQDKKKKKKQKK